MICRVSRSTVVTVMRAVSAIAELLAMICVCVCVCDFSQYFSIEHLVIWLDDLAGKPTLGKELMFFVLQY